MTEEITERQVNMNLVNEFLDELNKRDLHFCKDDCPVEPKNSFLGCECRPVKHMKECSRLKEYLKKEKQNEKHQGKEM